VFPWANHGPRSGPVLADPDSFGQPGSIELVVIFLASLSAAAVAWR
jgi:hypothetical protein